MHEHIVPHRCRKRRRTIETTHGPEGPKLRDAAAQGVVWTAAQTWGARLVSIAVFAVLGRQLDAAAFGLMAVAVAVVEFGRLLVDQGFSRNIVQRKDLRPEHLDTGFWTSVVSGVALTLVGVALSPVLASAFDEPDLAPVLRVLSLTFVLNSVTTTQAAILRRDLRFRPLAMRHLISVVGSGVVSIAFALGGSGVWALVAQSLSQSLFAAVLLWTASPWRPGGRISRSAFGEMFSFAATTLAIELIGFFARRGDDILIGAFLGATVLGFFNVAYRILTIVMELFTSTINAVAFPVFSRLQGEPGRIRHVMHVATRMSSALACPAFVGIIVLAPEFVELVFGDGWEPSIKVLQIIALTGVLRSITYFNRALLLGLGKASWELGWVIVFVITKVIAFAIGQRWGLEGVAWAMAVHGYTLAPAGIWLINRATPLHPATYLRQFLFPVGASLVMAAVMVPLRSVLVGEFHNAVVLAVCGAVGGLMYAGALAVMAPSLLRELVSEARRVAHRPASPQGPAAGAERVGEGRSPNQPDVPPRRESSSNGVT
jgi:PST family polysaccharide transporter